MTVWILASCLIANSHLQFGLEQDESGDPVVMVNDDDQEMLDAQKKARESVDQFIAALIRPKAGQTMFSVKGEFRDGQQREFMWLTDVRYSGGMFIGRLNNQPRFVKNVAFGQPVQLARDQINDWLIMENGKMIGGYTVAVLSKRSAANEPKSEPANQPIEHDFSTPEGAILCLEDAYRAKDFEAAVKCKDFQFEARLMIEKIDPVSINDKQFVDSIAETLEAAFRNQLQTEGFPEMTGVVCEFPEKTPLDGRDDIVVVTERCTYPDGKTSLQKLLVAKTANGWRVIKPVEE